MATASTLFSSISNPKITAENLFCRNASLKTLLCLLAGICCTFSAKFSGSTLQEAMSYAIKNQTNPLTISATGYAPYIEARARKASQKTGPLSQAEKNAQRIRDYWIRQDFANEIEQYAKDHEKDLFRNRWECAADKKGLYSRVQWEMDKINDQMDHELDKRRNRLSELLKSEEDALMKESFAPKEDPESRHERMLSRYKELRMQKEEERVKVAEEKKEQQFKRNCEELRTLMSRKIATEIAEEGRKARYEKMCDAKERDKEEALYADMWLRDAEAKKEKEDRDEKEKKRHDAKYGGYIKDQMQQKRLEKQKVLREKETDAEIRAEQERLDKLEEEYEKQMKRRRQQGVKRDLDECLREKLKRKAKEVQEGLLQDLFFLKQIMEGEEEEIKNEKKKALLKEQQDYLQHIRDQMRREDEFQREVDQLYQEELEKLWERRRREWEEERNKRRQMEADVMDGVKEQIMINAEKGRKNELLTLEYGRKVLEEDEEDRRRDKERLRMIRERNNQHQRELREQIRQKEDRMADEKRFLDSELDRLRTAREEEEVKIKNLLQEVEIDNQHPYRVIRREKFDDCRPLQN